ncbi:MFS transporter [Brevibacillus brevis]|uniref:MFS transporter n=1 Tax=Brevibacillus brevis TaxID=1393 RepID=UPI000D0F43C8|nr:MFS transporter [Brevibacillus brevis]PSJ68049.1 antiporter [Brevibacillus brevis]RED35523.1 DHA2 family metal-tetracycline-proton antiporter-like MFS transporter [Brevibacillus brevis]GEC87809.1 MFS transporter [Brevibacillus brevis]VEF89366.1 Antiseptic resistance protein [Brevibacillus brevis]
MNHSDFAMENSNKLLRVLVVTLIFSVMNGTMFNVALPEIAQEFHLMPSQVSWIMTGYMVVYAIGSVVFGKLADQYRLKDLLTYGLLIFAVGSIVGMIATEYWMIILGRILQASGASVLPATAMIIPIRYFAPEQRGRALGTSAVGLALGNAFGPVVAGLMASFGSWRMLFLISLLPLFTLPFFRKYLDDEKGAPGSIDFLGGGLLAAAVAVFLLSITESSGLLFAGGIVLLAMFIVRIRTAEHPFIQPGLFRNRYFSVGLIIAFLSTALSFSVMFMTPQFLSALNQLPAGSIGFVLFPAAIASALMGRKGGLLADERGNFFVVSLAAFFMLVCFSLLSTFVGISPIAIAVILILGNVGQTFMQIALSNTLSRTLVKEQTGVGMGLFSMLNFISGAVAMSLIGKALDNQAATMKINPLVTNPAASVYSNIFLLLAILIIGVWILYRLQFHASTSTTLVHKDEPSE